MTPLYSLFVDLTGQSVLVVGAGKVAQRYITGLHAAGASVTVIASTIGKDITALSGITPIYRYVQDADITPQYKLVFAATNDPIVNQRICQQCHALGIWVNRADTSTGHTMIAPTLLLKDPIQVAVSTGSPLLTRQLKREINDLIGDDYPALAAVLKAVRKSLPESIPSADDRGRFWKKLFGNDLLQLLRTRGMTHLKQHIENQRLEMMASLSESAEHPSL